MPLRCPPVVASRRSVLLGGASALVLSGSLPALAQAPAAPFSFDILIDAMRTLAARPFEAPQPMDLPLPDLDYDQYRAIRFRPDHARWADAGRFQIHAFHPGWLFPDPVRLFEVTADQAVPMGFSTADFEYRNEVADQAPADAPLPAIAGFRLHHPLNRPDVMDELVVFLGASYFRALGAGNAYGLSARGLALNSAVGEPEEFPRFTDFWLERPAPGAVTVTIHAAMDSPSVTGAYRFVITPGAETVMDVTARLFFRSEVTELGVAPLTSMFLYAEKNRSDFDDYRPAVHDSNGLMILRADGDVIWRPLNNPFRLAGSYLAETSPRAFGLMQRGRDFAMYEDPEAHYERRPSLLVEPLGDWGPGMVRVIEIPTDLEVNDNIVAYWVPEAPVQAGEAREFSYRLRWGALDPDFGAPLAHVEETRAGEGGVSGVSGLSDARKFVVDFAGGPVAALPQGAAIDPVVTVAGGTVETVVLKRMDANGRWRLVIDVLPEADVVELSAHLAGYGRKLSELWVHQWVVS